MYKKIFIVSLLLVLCSFIRISANSLFVIINDTVKIENDVNITLYLDNIEYDNFTFKLYSSESLEGVNTNDIDINNYNNEEISFDYCINCSSLKTIVLNYKLPSSISVGDNITFNVQIINKDNTEEVKTYRKVVTVIEEVKEEENETQEDKKDIFNKGSFPGRSNFNFSKSSNTSGVSNKYKGSSNNYLSNISIKGYELNKEFMKERLTYFVTVPNNVKSLDIKVSKENKDSSVNISGNSNFEVGLNKVLITVTAKDGRIKNYRIYVTRMDSDSNEE